MSSQAPQLKTSPSTSLQQKKGGILKPYQSQITVLQNLLDGFIIFGVIDSYYILNHKATWLEERVLFQSLVLYLIFSLFANMVNLYHSWRTTKPLQELKPLWVSWTLSFTISFFLFLHLKSIIIFKAEFSSYTFWLPPTIMSISRFGVRTFLRLFRSQGANRRNIVIAGAGILGIRIAQTIIHSPWMGMKLFGFYDDHKEADKMPIVGNSITIIGDLEKLVEDAKIGKFDQVYVALPMRAEQRIIDLVNKLANTTVSVNMIPDIFIFKLFNARWFNIEGIPAVSIFESPMYGVTGFFKRIFDIVFSILVLLIALVPILFIVLGIKLTSKGPIFFRQKRYGLDGKEINVWKFRTMTVCENGDTVIQAQKNDLRITKFGAFLRKTSLDELPQFFNVLEGSMSVVGPRPHAIAHNEAYRDLIYGYMLRHKVKPGITGWAQINGWRGETDTLDKMQRRVEHDLYYINNWSLWLDIKIIFLTLFRGFVHENAY